MFSFLRPYIFNIDPETAHDLAIKSLKFNILPKAFFDVKDEEVLETKLFDKKLPNPIGLAAGFDKSAEVYNEIFKLGFGKRQLYPKGNGKKRPFALSKP